MLSVSSHGPGFYQEDNLHRPDSLSGGWKFDGKRSGESLRLQQMFVRVTPDSQGQRVKADNGSASVTVESLSRATVKR